MKSPRLPIIGFLTLLLVLPIPAAPGPASRPVTDHPRFPKIREALTHLVRQRGGEGRATLFIPRYRERDDEVVIFWAEERALFLFGLDFRPEVIEHPSLVSRRFWRLTDECFYPANSRDPGHHASTYMQTWEWAKDRMLEAVKDGHLLTIEPLK